VARARLALGTLVALAVCAGAAPSSTAAAGASVKRAPSSPPLTASEIGVGAGGAEEAPAMLPQVEADPLVSNGLGSPGCEGVAAGGLSASARRDCETSGFAAAPAPTGDYGLDVHINSGALNIGSWGWIVTQDLLIAPLWMALVWAVHALVVMLEWAFTVNLFGSATAVGVGSGLRRMQSTFTESWLPIALAAASILALYHGLIRRRVAETLGETLLMVAMMVAGLWVILDPTGTVGALGEWADQASVGTLAVAAGGSPVSPGRTLASGLETVFVAAIEAPWCYLEFGNVNWCRQPSELSPRLHAAGLRIAAEERAAAGCSAGATEPASCAGGAHGDALEHSAELLVSAQSNGALFLALPANDAARNSINDQGSLLRTLCDSSDATSCRGPTAAEAEFRTSGATLSRLGGALLIAGGLLGMLLLLGFIAVRLLTAALFSLLYLLLAPAMVLAPAFGDGGRALFRKWAARLLAAVVSKLAFSFLLGVLLAIISILSELRALGWWTQWLLMSAFWWSVYTRRHQAFALARDERAERRSALRRVGGVLESRKGMAVARWAKSRRSRPAPTVEQRRGLAHAGRALARAGGDEQVRRTLEAEHRDANARSADAAQITNRLSAKRARLELLRRERGHALAAGDTRRAARLGHRGEGVRGEIEREQQALDAAQRTARGGEQAHRRTGELYTRERREQQRLFLDEQAALPSSARARRGDARRDYAALSRLAGYGREEYERLDPRNQRAARLEIDRELALRSELAETARTLASEGQTPHLGRRERAAAGRRFDGVLHRRMQEGKHRMPASHGRRSAVEDWRAAGRSGRAPGPEHSSVMRDAREVAARRKRQLGKDRP
jgi:hypothetical protein